MKPQATINRGLNFSSSQRIAGLAYAVASASAKALVPCFKTQNLKFFLVILMVSASSITCSDRQKPREDSKKQSFSEIIRGFSAADTTRAGRYFSQAERLAKAAKYDSAIAYFEKASVLYEAEKNWEKHIRCRNKIGEQYWRQGAFDEALSYLNEVLETGRQRLGEQHLESAASYHNLGKVYNLTGQYEQALEFYQRALNIRLAKLGEQHPEVGSSYNDIGSVYYFQSDYDEAIKFYEKALAIRRHTLGERHADVAASCSNLANVYAQKGDYDLAIAGFNQALSVWLAVGSRLAAGAYHNLGNVYRDKGDFDQAILFHEKALSIQLSALGEQNPELAIYYYSLGNDYHSKEDYDRAIACFEKALSLRQRAFGRDHPEVASTYTALGVNHEEKGDYAKALDFYNMALSIWQATLGTQHPDAADVYQNIGSIALKKRDYTKAFVCYEKALSIYRATFGEHHPSVAIGCNEIGSIYVEQEAYDRALELFQRGICANAPEFSNPDPYVNPPLHGILDETELQTSLFNKARALARRYKRQSHQQRDLETALSTYELLVQLIDQIRSGYKAEGSKFFLAGTTTDIYEQAIQCALQLSEATQNAAPKNAAFLFAEKSKAGIMLDALSEAEAKQFAGIPDSLLQKERQLRIDLAFYDGKLTEEQLQSAAADSATLAHLKDKVFNLKQAYDALLQRFEKEYPDYYNLKYQVKTVSMPEVQQLLDDRTALVEYFTGEDSIFIFAVNKNNFAIKVSAKDSLFERQIEQLREGVVKQDFAQYTQAAYRLYQTLLAPLKAGDQLNNKNLSIVPDAALSAIPFEALLTEQVEAKGNLQDYMKFPFLVKSHAVSYAYSATLLQQEQSRRNRETKRDYLAFAPVFANGLPAGTRGGDFFKENFVHDSSQTATASASATRIRGYLPMTKKEVTGILDRFENAYSFFERWFGNKSRVYLEREAKEEKLKAGDVGEYRILHFATHGLVNEKNPKLSGLILSPEDSTASEDGILRLGEIYNLKLNADLVVLSACETGLGQVARGEGIIGLTRGFLYAGASNVLVSLWQVSDVTTADLMVDFYDKMLGGMSKPEALREAKLQMIRRHAEYAKPYYWAPFILVGR